MRRNVLRGLRIWSALLLISGYFALSTTPAYGSQILLIPLIFLPLAPLGERLDGRYPAYRRITLLFNLAYLVSIPLTFNVYHLMQLVVALIIYIQVFTLLHKKTVRNFHHLYLMAFFLLLSATVQSPEPGIGLAMAMFLISSLMALTMLQIWTETERAADDRVPDIIPLDALDATQALAQPKRLFDSGLTLAMAGVSALALLLTAVIFLLTPRMEAGILGRTTPAQAETEVTSSVDLTTGGSIQRDQRIVMRVEFPEERSGLYNGLLLWRTTALNVYDAAKWERGQVYASRRQPMLALSSEQHATNSSEAEVWRAPFEKGRLVRQSIYLDNIATQDLPTLPLAQHVKFASNVRGVEMGWTPTRDFSVALTRMPRQSWLQYDAWSEVQNFTAEELRAAPSDYESQIRGRNYEVLTQHDLEPETVELAKQLTANAKTPYDKALAVGDFLNGNGFLYSLDVPNYPAQHPVDVFINKGRLGHCEFFASAMALMLRSLGVPARVVGGYRGGEWTKGDRAYAVRADMAHLWVEVYFIDIGWVAFDPSPPDPGLTGLRATRIAKLMSRYMVHLKMIWYRDIIGFNRGFQIEALRNIALGIVGFGRDLLDSSSTTKTSPRPGSSILSYALILLGFLALVLWLSKRRQRPNGRPVLTDDQRRATKLYELLRKRTVRYGIPTAGLSAEEVQCEVAESALQGKAEVQQLIDAYNESRFGGAPLADDRYRRLKQLLTALRPPPKQ